MANLYTLPFCKDLYDFRASATNLGNSSALYGLCLRTGADFVSKRTRRTPYPFTENPLSVKESGRSYGMVRRGRKQWHGPRPHVLSVEKGALPVFRTAAAAMLDSLYCLFTSRRKSRARSGCGARHERA